MKRVMRSWRDLWETIFAITHKRVFQELLRFGFWGVATSCISFFSYCAFLLFGLDYRIANLISMLLTKASAYFANKFFVFHSKRETKRELLKEIVLFIITRGLSGFIEYIGLIILVDICGAGQLFGKCVMIVMVIILNYALGKTIVYRARTDL